MRNNIILNGVNSNTINGLIIQELPPISKPKMRTQIEEIDGRDGDIVTKLGYSAYDKEFSIGLCGNFDIDEIIAYFNSEGTVVFSNEDDKYYNYQILEQIDFERLIRFRTATVIMHVQPFKYSTTEEEITEEVELITGEGSDITLNDTVETTFNSIDISGNTYQASNLSPSSPQDVEVVTGDNTITISGNNLLDEDYYNNADLYTINVYKYTKTNIKGNRSLYAYVSLKEGKTSISGLYFCLCTKRSPNVAGHQEKWLVNNGDIIANTSVNFTDSDLYLTWYPATVTPSQIFETYNIMVSTSNIDYEPYKGMKNYPINLGTENLANDSFSSYTTSSGNYAYIKLIETFTKTNLILSLTDKDTTVDISGVYIGLSGNGQNSSDGISWLISNGTVVQENNYISSTSLKYLSFYPKNETTFNKIFQRYNVMAELTNKSTPSAYTPYGAIPIELCKIGDYKDSIIYQNNKWYLHKEIGKVVLDGSENWSKNNYISGSDVAGYTFSPILSDIALMNTGTDIGYICDKFICVNSSSWNANNEHLVQMNDKSLLFVINKNIASDVATFKTWLGTNNTSVYYVLETATDTEITDTTLIGQLEALKSATSYDGVTNITTNYTAGNVPMILSVSVYGDNEITVKNSGNIGAKPTFTIYGSGNIGMYLNNSQVFNIALGDDGYITIDIANMEAYKASVLKNRLVTGDYNNFLLHTGDNTIYFTGIVSKFEISNYSRWL